MFMVNNTVMTPLIQPAPASLHPHRPKVGIVLGSGGSRGVVHLPILEALPHLGIPVDLIAGSSIGAVVAGVYATGALVAFQKDLRAMKREGFLKLFDPSLSRSGLFSGRKTVVFLHRYIPRHTRIEDLSVPLGIVATDYDSGCPVIFRKGNLLEAIRASISIPGVFTPARFGQALLLDGGVANPLPIDIAENMGADLTIAVSLQPAIGKLGLAMLRAGRGEMTTSEKIPAVEKFVHRLAAGGRGENSGPLKAADQWLIAKRNASMSRRSSPNLIEIVARTIDIMEYTETLQMLASHPPTVLLEFDFPEIGVLDFSRTVALLEKSRRVLESKKPELIEKVLNRLSEPA